MLSSASIPGAFSPTYLDGMVLVDGSLFTSLDLWDAILKCSELVEDEKDIIVDIIMCFDDPASIKEWTLEEAKWKTSNELSKRGKEIGNYYYNYYEDILRVTVGFPDVTFRHIITPSVNLPS